MNVMVGGNRRQRVGMAINSDQSDRLLQIAAEHAKLARRTSDGRKDGTLSVKEFSAALDQIAQLRKEREAIIDQFRRIPANERKEASQSED